MAALLDCHLFATFGIDRGLTLSDSGVRGLAKQPVASECFEEAFLEYLRLRFEVEPLPHYALAAMHLCDESGRDYPAFARAFMAWFAESFLFDQQGVFPAQSHNADPADHRWRRFADCHALLEGWRRKDLKAALEQQAERWELVEEVARLRSEQREDAAGKQQRVRAKAKKTDAEVFDVLEEWFATPGYTLKRTFKKLSEPREFMRIGPIPIALVRSPAGYEVKCLAEDS